MENITHRIKLIAENEGIKITQLESKIGASKGVLSRSLNNSTDIQSKWITNIVENYPQYSAEWLLTGKGQMMRGNNYQLDNSENFEIAEPEIIYNSTVKKCASCYEKDKQIELLRQIITDKDKIIVLLEKQLTNI